MTTSSASIRIVALALVISAWTACRTADDAPPPSSAVHAVHSEKLLTLMRQIGQFDEKLAPQELDGEGQQAQRFARVAELATELGASAHTIPDVLEGVSLSDEQRSEFDDLVHALEARANEVADAAKSGESDTLNDRIEALHASCNDCHQRFRVLPALR